MMAVNALGAIWGVYIGLYWLAIFNAFIAGSLLTKAIDSAIGLEKHQRNYIQQLEEFNAKLRDVAADSLARNEWYSKELQSQIDANNRATEH